MAETITINPISSYKEHMNKVSEQIESGPFKMNYICKKLGVSRVTLYNKRKNNSFTLKEVETLTDLFSKV